MNTVLLLDQIADGFEKAVREGWIKTHICHFEGRLQILPANHTTKRHKVFSYFTNRKLIKGFDTREWDSIIRNIVNYYEELEKCHSNLKHSPPTKATFF